MGTASLARRTNAPGRMGAFLLLSAAGHLLAFLLYLAAWTEAGRAGLPVVEVYAVAAVGPVPAADPALHARAPRGRREVATAPSGPADPRPAPAETPVPAQRSAALPDAPPPAPAPPGATEPPAPPARGGVPPTGDGPAVQPLSGATPAVATAEAPVGGPPSGRSPSAAGLRGAAVPPGAGPATTASGGRAGGAQGGGSALRRGSGYSVLRAAIESRIVYPEDAVRRGEEGEVLLRIRVADDGYPREIRVARSSGARSLDEAARRGVVRAAPLPSEPGWVEVPVLFRLVR